MKDTYERIELYLKANGFNFSDFYLIGFTEKEISFQGFLTTDLLKLKYFKFQNEEKWFKFEDKDGIYRINIILIIK